MELLEDILKPGDKILDIGSGSGYLTACFALMLGKSGKVFGIEHIEELIEMSKDNIAKNHMELLESKRIEFILGAFIDRVDTILTIFDHFVDILTYFTIF